MTTTDHALQPPASAPLLPVEETGVAFDWPRIAAYLAEQGYRLDPGFTPRRFVGGLANVNMLLRVDDGWAVLRRPPPGPLPKGAHDMAREHKVLSALDPYLAIAPQSILFCEDESVAGAPFQLLAYHEGRVVRGGDISPLPPTAETGVALSAMLVDTLASIHAVDTETAGLSDLGRPEGFLTRTAKGWIARAASILNGERPAACAAVVDWLEAQDQEEVNAPVLLHNDFKLDNIILAKDAIAPHKVIDWDMATRGDPMMDVATLLSYWTEADDPECMLKLDQMPTAGQGFMRREQAAMAYAERTGRSLEGFLFPRVLAIFKLGVVFLQLRALGAQNAKASARIDAVNPHELFQFALDVAHGKRF